MTKAMPFLQKAILLSYDPRRFRAVFVFNLSVSHSLDSSPIEGSLCGKRYFNTKTGSAVERRRKRRCLCMRTPKHLRLLGGCW